MLRAASMGRPADRLAFATWRYFSLTSFMGARDSFKAVFAVFTPFPDAALAVSVHRLLTKGVIAANDRKCRI